jgi:hypothetical protein
LKGENYGLSREIHRRNKEKYIGLDESFDVKKKMEKIGKWIDVAGLAQHYILKHKIDASQLKKDKKTMDMLNKIAEIGKKTTKGNMMPSMKSDSYKEMAKLLTKLDIYDWTKTP